MTEATGWGSILLGCLGPPGKAVGMLVKYPGRLPAGVTVKLLRLCVCHWVSRWPHWLLRCSNKKKDTETRGKKVPFTCSVLPVPATDKTYHWDRRQRRHVYRVPAPASQGRAK